MHTALTNQLSPSLFHPNSPRYFPAYMYSVIFDFCFMVLYGKLALRFPTLWIKRRNSKSEISDKNIKVGRKILKVIQFSQELGGEMVRCSHKLDNGAKMTAKLENKVSKRKRNRMKMKMPLRCYHKLPPVLIFLRSNYLPPRAQPCSFCNYECHDI